MFSDRGVKMLVKCLQICAHVFIDRPQNCAQTSFRSCAGSRPNFGHSRCKLCPIMCRSRTKLCPNFGCSRARLCPIYFAPCPFPNLAGTLSGTHHPKGIIKAYYGRNSKWTLVTSYNLSYQTNLVQSVKYKTTQIYRTIP